MKSVRYALMFAACLVLPACNDDMGPTAPVQSPEVSGSWQGTVSYQALVGFYVDPTCPDQPVTVQLQVEGSTVTGTIQAECVTAQIEGRVYNQTIRARVTQVVDGEPPYTAVLDGSFVGFPVSQIEASTEIFVNSNGWQRESFTLRLAR